MGTWGYKSNENDDCGDAMSDVLRKGVSVVLGKIDNMKNEDDFDSTMYVGVVREIIEIGLTREHVRRAIVRAENLLKNKEYINSYKSPQARRANLRAEIKMFNKFLDEQKDKP